MQVITSQIDSSVNFIEQDMVGFVESRYVRRTDDYFICYLSSQTGCNRMCRFCHLTATGQTQYRNCTVEEFAEQADNVFAQYETDARPKAKYVHFNFMARGEALANPTVTDHSFELLYSLGRKALEHGVPPKFNISTIMPTTMKKSLVDMFPIITPTIYYSLYSMDQQFRKHWLPAAMDAEKALRLLTEYQDHSKKIIKFHGAFIAGENDSAVAVEAMIDAVMDHGIRAEWNIVRYNSAGPEYGEETSETRLVEIAEQIGRHMPCKIVSRVGEDVYASCGTFFS